MDARGGKFRWDDRQALPERVVLAASGTAAAYVPGTDGPFTVGMRSDVAFRWGGPVG